MEFQGYPKMARLSREVVITEKIDGTNAQIYIEQAVDAGLRMLPLGSLGCFTLGDQDFYVYAGSRTRWITPENDNFGFARWVSENVKELLNLGIGRHFGEWWGGKIQRGYGLKEKRLSLFHVDHWESLLTRPDCCDRVPVLYRGDFNELAVTGALSTLSRFGSYASPGYMDPEGIVVWHTAANIGFKKTIKDDEKPKSLDNQAKKA
jgi:hypothetical protein